MASKKNNKNKPWERGRSPYRIESIEPSKKTLIICEGQTEDLYFKSFDVLNLKVESVDSEGRSNMSLIKFCDKKKAEYEKKGIEFDEVWCVFDMDIKEGGREYADFDNAIEACKSRNYKVAYSNDVFELWFYLHFNFTDEPNHRDFYYDQLSKWWNTNYKKHGKTKEWCKKNYTFLNLHEESSQEEAIRRAEKMHKRMKHLPFHEQNPVTTVYLLVKNLNKFLRGISKSVQ